jgi:hypothetical protein
MPRKTKQAPTAKAESAPGAALLTPGAALVMVPGAQVEDRETGARLPMAAYAALSTRRPQLMEVLRRQVESGQQALSKEEVAGLLAVCVEVVRWMEETRERDARIRELVQEVTERVVAARVGMTEAWERTNELRALLAERDDRERGEG